MCLGLGVVLDSSGEVSQLSPVIEGGAEASSVILGVSELLGVKLSLGVVEVGGGLRTGSAP